MTQSLSIFATYRKRWQALLTIHCDFSRAALHHCGVA